MMTTGILAEAASRKISSSKVSACATASAAEPAAAMAAATSPASRARLCWIAWNFAIGRSNATRSFA